MAKTMTIAYADGSTGSVDGNVAILSFGNRKLRAFIHNNTLSHYASGRRICDLRPYKILAHKSYQRITSRHAAELALQDLAAKIGAEKAWQVMDNAPVINPK